MMFFLINNQERKMKMEKNYLVTCKTFSGFRDIVVTLEEGETTPLRGAIEALEEQGHGKVIVIGVFPISDEDARYLSEKPEYNGDQSIAELYQKAEACKKTIQAANEAIASMRQFEENLEGRAEALPEETKELIDKANEASESGAVVDETAETVND